jgi:helix-turn-helix protein
MFVDLVELGVLDELRVRREVALSARGRHIATDAIADQ